MKFITTLAILFSASLGQAVTLVSSSMSCPELLTSNSRSLPGREFFYSTNSSGFTYDELADLFKKFYLNSTAHSLKQELAVTFSKLEFFYPTLDPNQIVLKSTVSEKLQILISSNNNINSLLYNTQRTDVENWPNIYNMARKNTILATHLYALFMLEPEQFTESDLKLFKAQVYSHRLLKDIQIRTQNEKEIKAIRASHVYMNKIYQNLKTIVDN